MAMSVGFKDYLLDLLDPIGPVSAKRIFGGGGLFLHGSMFALIADDALYFKVDEGNAAAYDTAEAHAFTYMRGDKELSMSYREVPAGLTDDAEELCRWAEQAWQAARRSGTSAKKKKRSNK
jgi:DNA transformation protein and related proteins